MIPTPDSPAHAETTATENTETIDISVPTAETAVSRRGFLRGLGGTGALAAVGTAGLSQGVLDVAPATADDVNPLSVSQRQKAAFRLRRDAADFYRRFRLPQQRCNGDEARYVDLRANFFKTLPQNNLGEVDPGAYTALIDALSSGDPADFELIPLSPQADRRLANPQAAYAYELTGLDGNGSRIRKAPRFDSAEQAAEMGEVFWHALLRDVPFRDYGSNADVAQAVADLNAFSETVGPPDNGPVTPGTIFRGETPGDLTGPYISQFLWQPVPFGINQFEQRYHFPLPGSGNNFMTDPNEWLAIQRGASPVSSITFDPTPRYIYSGRAMGEYVHVDVTFQAYLNAALIMAGYGPNALAVNNPYLTSTTQSGFVTFGLADVVDLVTKAANAGLKAAWYQKWLVHRRLRPEVFAARASAQADNVKNYDVNQEFLDSEAFALVSEEYGVGLLPMAFPEGSPTHPSYPAGHACNAGACATILKAFFNEDFPVPNPVEASADGLSLDPYAGSLTLGGEINKLANNISLGRDFAGVHYRSDGIQGIRGGEQVALGILVDYSRTYNEDFDGFELTLFDGRPVRIRNGKIRFL